VAQLQVNGREPTETAKALVAGTKGLLATTQHTEHPQRSIGAYENASITTVTTSGRAISDSFTNQRSLDKATAHYWAAMEGYKLYISEHGDDMPEVREWCWTF
jgi:hypothetical protein